MKRIYGRCVWLLAVLIGIVAPTTAQLDSVHWIPPFHAGSDLGEHYLYLSTPSPAPIFVDIILGNGLPARDRFGNALIGVELSNTNPRRVDLGQPEIGESSSTLVLVNDLNRPLRDKGIRLRGTAPFYCNFRVGNFIQAGSLTAKGSNAKGLSFRVGHIENYSLDVSSLQRSNFVSFMATEDDTRVVLSDYDTDLRLHSAFGALDPGAQIEVVLNQGEVYVISLYVDPTRPAANANGMMGSLLESDKPVVVNCGSWLGSPLLINHQDIGIDQIVPIDRVGDEYILVRGDGPDLLETPLVIATENNTDIFINGSAAPVANLDAGEYFRVLESYYTTDENLYIRTSAPAYVYQMLAGANDTRTGGLNFLPSLGCSDESVIDNLMEVDAIGLRRYEGKLFVVAERGKDVFINGNLVPPILLNDVLGKPEHVTYKATNLSGNVSVRSNGAIQVGLFGRNDAAGWAGYFSGFDRIDAPKIELKASKSCDGTLFVQDNQLVDSIEWFFEGQPLGRKEDTLFLSPPGRYYAVGLRTLCEQVYRDTSEILVVPEPLELEVLANDLACEDSKRGVVWIQKLTGGYPPYEISINGLSLGPGVNQVDTLGLGWHQVEIIDSFGCIIRDSIEIELDLDLPLLQIDLPDTLTCRLLEIDINAEVSHRHSDLSWNWSTRDGQIRSATDRPTVRVGSLGLYFVEIEDLRTGCTVLDSVWVNEDVSQPSIALEGGTGINCFTTEVNLRALFSASSDSISLNWSTDTGRILEVWSDSIKVDKGGEYQVVITNLKNGCQDTADVFVVQDLVKPQLRISPPEVLNCLLTETTLFGSFSTSRDKVHQWRTSDGRITRLAQPNAPIVDRGGTYHWLVIDTSNGCRDSISVTVEQDTVRPVVDAGIDGLLTCTDTIVQRVATIEACPLCLLQWQTDTGNIVGSPRSNELVADKPGWFRIRAINPNNECWAEDSIFIDQAPDLTGAACELKPPDCDRRTGDILIGQIEGGTEPFKYSTDGGVTFGDDGQFLDLNPGSYGLVVEDQYGCRWSLDTAFVGFEPIRITDFIDTVTIEFGDTARFESRVNLADSLIRTIEWEDATELSCSDCLNPWVFRFENGVYTLYVEDENGCWDEIRVVLIVKKIIDVFVPNVFTPDGNKVNDGFTAFVNEKAAKAIRDFQIFDRWGELIFRAKNIEPNDPSMGWDGMFLGEPMLPGVYVYTIEVEFKDGSTQQFSGDVTLLR